MKNTFVVSDLHLGHRNICKFMQSDGKKVRPWDDPDEMDEFIIQEWNKIVKPTDRVYNLGDVCINRKHLHKMSRLNGDHVLIKGNHCIFKANEYLQYFRDIRASHPYDKFLLTHIPIHVDSLARWDGNIHGHLHTNNVMLPNGEKDYRYFCVCVEQTNFRPMEWSEIKLVMQSRKIKYPELFGN